MNRATSRIVEVPSRDGRAVLGVLLVARLHVDLCRRVSAACRA
ncbi:hypothetical protein [Actinacidiphila yeochonensis]|nr:hypothetical protein [Actinacidiphila yeochonensis]